MFDTATKSTALLVMDVQQGVMERFSSETAYLDRMVRAIAAARAAQVAVIYVIVEFRPGHPEVSDRNATFAAIASAGRLTEGDPATKIHPAIAPLPADVVVVKRRISAFAGSELELILRAREIHSLVLAGVSTSGVVLSTVREAADLDYGLTVLSDACLDGDPEVQRILIERVFPRQATVSTVTSWISGLR